MTAEQRKTLQGNSFLTGFRIWFFDREEAFVAKYAGSRQCFGGGKTLEAIQQELEKVEIVVRGAQGSHDGPRHMTMCGASDGRIYVFKILPKDRASALMHGFFLIDDAGPPHFSPLDFASAGRDKGDAFPWPGRFSSRSPQTLGTTKAEVTQYDTLNVGLSSGRLFRLSYRRVVAMLAWPSHS